MRWDGLRVGERSAKAWRRWFLAILVVGCLGCLWKEGDGIAVKEDLAAVDTELANAKQVVMEGGHDMAAAVGKVEQVEVHGGRRVVDVAGGITYMGCRSVRVDFVYWGGGSDVYVTSTCVGNCCV